MNKVIPLHSLVIAVGASANTRTNFISQHFPSYEVVSAASICEELVGEPLRPDLNSVIFAEVRHRLALKLSLGQRVVVDAQNLRREDRITLARIAIDQGAPVFYLVCDPAGADPLSLSRYQQAEREIMHGDNLAEVIDWRKHRPAPISPRKPDLAALRERYNGITVISDVHGMSPSLLSALSWARSRNHYVVLLGDVIDYGPDTLEVAEEAYRLVMRGEGEMLLGNHERKIARWAQQAEAGRVSIRLSEGNKVTTTALTRLGAPARRRWLGRFQALVAQGSYCRQIGNLVLAHAGVHPNFWTGTATAKDIETWSLFGEFQSGAPSGTRPAQVHTWVDAVPNEMIVIVGHEIRAERPLRVTGRLGGLTVFADTGSGKGGHLSSVDLRFTGDGLRVENFNIY